MPTERELTVRDCLKLAGAGLFTLVLIGAEDVIQNLVHSPVLKPFLFGPKLEDLPINVPPRFRQDQALLQENEHLRDSCDLVSEAFLIYSGWQKKDKNLGKLTYRPPDNYLGPLGLSASVFDDLIPVFRGGKMTQRRMEKVINDITADVDQPGSSFISFSFKDIDGPQSLIRLDPGSGFVAEIVDNLKNERGQDYNPYSDREINEMTVLRIFKSRFDRIKHYLDNERGGKQVSTSWLLAACLFENNGEIVPSLWDTVTFLKVLARNNLETLKKENTEEGARILSGMFLDDFSVSIPFDRLQKSYTVGELLRDEAGEGITFPDFNLHNRRGEYYHAWINIAGASCMEAWLVTVMNNYFYAKGGNGMNGREKLLDSGYVKSASDIRVAKRAGEIRQIYNRFLPQFRILIPDKIQEAQLET